MSLRSALAGGAVTAVLVGALGSPGATEAARDADQQALATTLTALPGWDAGDQPGEVVGGVALRLGVLLVAVTLLCGLAGRSGSRVAAFLGGWAALVVAGGVAGGAFYAYQVAVVLDGRTLAATYLDGLVAGANTGASFGLWTGWLVGLPVAATAARTGVDRGIRSRAPGTVAGPGTGDGGRTWAPAPVTADAPPPWWASTATPEIEPIPVRPGPSVFLPGEVPVPSARAAGGPEATQAMAIPPGADPDPTGVLAGDVDDPDATAVDATATAADEPSDPDSTAAPAAGHPTAPIDRPEG